MNLDTNTAPTTPRLATAVASIQLEVSRAAALSRRPRAVLLRWSADDTARERPRAELVFNDAATVSLPQDGATVAAVLWPIDATFGAITLAVKTRDGWHLSVSTLHPGSAEHVATMLLV